MALLPLPVHFFLVLQFDQQVLTHSDLFPSSPDFFYMETRDVIAASLSKMDTALNFEREGYSCNL